MLSISAKYNSFYLRQKKRKRRTIAAKSQQCLSTSIQSDTLPFVERAIADYKLTGNLTKYLKRLRFLASDRDSEEAEADQRAIAKYVLALVLCQLGQFTEADAHLHDLGFRYRLHRDIFFCPRKSGSNTNSSFVGKAVVYDNLIPSELYSNLLSAFQASSPFWTEHEYPTDQFFSYNIPCCNLQPNKNLLHQLISFLRPAVEQAFPSATRIASTEWWCHIREQGKGYEGGHQLHFDLDEKYLRDQLTANREANIRSDRLHPIVSSVVYLLPSEDIDASTAGSNHMATTILNQTVLEGSIADAAWMCSPAHNRVLFFDGTLLHGVVPGLPSTASIPASASASASEATVAKVAGKKNTVVAPRITLMIGWWGEEVSTSEVSKGIKEGKGEKAPLVLGPNMPMPKPTSLSSMVTKRSQQVSTNQYWNSFSKRFVSWPGILESLVVSKPFPSLPSKVISNANVTKQALRYIEGPIWEKVSIAKSALKVNSHNVLAKDSLTKTVDCVEFISMKELSALRAAQSKDIDDGDDDDDDDDEEEEDYDEEEEDYDDEEADYDEEEEDYDEVEEDYDEVEEDYEDKEEEYVPRSGKPTAVASNAVLSGEEVEFISIADLNRLRGQSTPSASASTNSKVLDNKTTGKPENRTRKMTKVEDEAKADICSRVSIYDDEDQEDEEVDSVKGNDVVFVGKWFLRSLDEIRTDVFGK